MEISKRVKDALKKAENTDRQTNKLFQRLTIEEQSLLISQSLNVKMQANEAKYYLENVESDIKYLNPQGVKKNTNKVISHLKKFNTELEKFDIMYNGYKDQKQG